jgi:hypothetical protein
VAHGLSLTRYRFEAGANTGRGPGIACCSASDAIARRYAGSAGRPPGADSRVSCHEPEEGFMSELLLDRAGRRRSPATLTGFHAGHPPGNKGLRYPADPPKSKRSSPSCEPPATERTAAAYAD